MIRIENLSKTYQSGTQAVKGLNLEAQQGEILALLGPNGAGKSSTIRILTTLSGFDEGRVTVADHDVDAEPDAVRRAIGYVAQETGVDYFLTGRENLMLCGRLYGMKKKDVEARIEELAGYFELDKHLDELVSGYSGGMRRKLDIASALIHRPQVLFLDEPTLGLDTKSRQALWRYIRRLNEEQHLTILLTTHYLEEADKLAARVAIIDHGQIKVIDTPDALKDSIHGDAVTLTFDETDTQSQALSEALKGEDYLSDQTWENGKLRLYVNNGATAIPRIMETAGRVGAVVANLAFARPTLDDVFIRYTGSSMLEEKEEGGEQWWEKWAGKGGGGKWAKKWQEQNAEEEGEEAPWSEEQKEQWQEGKWSEEEQKEWAQKQGWIQEEKSASETAESEEKSAEDSQQNQQQWQQGKWSEEEQKAWAKKQGWDTSSWNNDDKNKG